MKMLRNLLLAVALLGLAAAAACASNDTPSAPMPKYNGGEAAKMIELGVDDFEANPHLIREVELVRPGSLIVSLETSNATGLAWVEAAEISSPVVTQFSHALTTSVAAPGAAIAAEPVKSVWVFDSAVAGDGLIRFVYARPGAESPHWTLTIYLTVK